MRHHLPQARTSIQSAYLQRDRRSSLQAQEALQTCPRSPLASIWPPNQRQTHFGESILMTGFIMRLSLWATNRVKKEQNDHRSALLYSHLHGARVARQHCSTLRPGNTILSPLCLLRIGHLYFGENRTSPLWVDRAQLIS